MDSRDSAFWSAGSYAGSYAGSMEDKEDLRLFSDTNSTRSSLNDWDPAFTEAFSQVRITQQPEYFTAVTCAL